MAEAPKQWLLLRGLAREKRHWGAFPSLFAERLGAEALTLDLPGMGTEVARESPTRISDIVDDLRARWLEARADGPRGILAVSLGGMALMDWTSRYPGDFSRAVMVASSAGDLSPIHHRLRPPNYLRLLSTIFEGDLKKRERAVLSMVSSGAADLDRVAEEWAGYAASATPRRAAFARQLLAATRFASPEAIPVPLLVLGSRGDTFVDPRCSERLAERFRAPIQWHDSAGHDLPLDAPEWVAGAVRAWVGA